MPLELTPQEALAKLTLIATWIASLELLLRERVPLSRQQEVTSELRRIRGVIAREPLLAAECLKAASWIVGQSEAAVLAIASDKPRGARWMQIVPEQCKEPKPKAPGA